jgi:hypothetical protein
MGIFWFFDALPIIFLSFGNNAYKSILLVVLYFNLAKFVNLNFLEKKVHPILL